MSTSSSPWWLEEGQEQCSSCLQGFHYEALSFCEGCDGPICSSCTTLIIATRETFCRACKDQEDKQRGAL